MARHTVPLALSLTLSVAVPTAGVHPEATLKAARSSATAGATLAVTGEDFKAHQKVQLVLRGVLGEYRIAAATATEEGTFALPLKMPADARPGRYQLVALADDGDVVARLELTMEVPAAGPADEPGAAGPDASSAAMAGGHEMMAPARDLPIERSFSGAGWGIIGLLVGLAGGLGLGLLRRPA
jgi:hypothetical protein